MENDYDDRPLVNQPDPSSPTTLESISDGTSRKECKPALDGQCSRCTPTNPNWYSMKSDVVKLNVGGVIYTTTSRTLLSRGENFFTALLSNKVPTTILDDAYFIDRNGHYFAPVLDYLRTGASPYIPL